MIRLKNVNVYIMVVLGASVVLLFDLLVVLQMIEYLAVLNLI